MTTQKTHVTMPTIQEQVQAVTFDAMARVAMCRLPAKTLTARPRISNPKDPHFNLSVCTQRHVFTLQAHFEDDGRVLLILDRQERPVPGSTLRLPKAERVQTALFPLHVIDREFAKFLNSMVDSLKRPT